ncbi:unnamed protein product [Camellia sinensis]
MLTPMNSSSISGASGGADSGEFAAKDTEIGLLLAVVNAAELRCFIMSPEPNSGSRSSVGAKWGLRLRSPGYPENVEVPLRDLEETAV